MDVHPQLGNNAQLARLLGITDRRPLEPWDKRSVGRVGKFEQLVTPEQLSARIESVLSRQPLHIDGGQRKRLKALPGAQEADRINITIAAEQGIDAFISGEISERTVHIARGNGHSLLCRRDTMPLNVMACRRWASG